MIEQWQKDLIARYLAAYNAFEIEAMLAQLDPAVRFENFAGGQLTAETSGIDAFRALAEQSKAMFSEREQRVTGLALDGETVVADIAWRGKLAAGVPDGPPAGTLLEMNGRSEFSFGAGGITKIVDRS
ncbi:nuclear transport factor 2 family protein [Massilia aerilata]|uniref:Nuclear transport factor 2 family protein n=1 Tax=Massilia aerilata TaxID=453817 RepID=A0ABW0RV33_9BURK